MGADMHWSQLDVRGVTQEQQQQIRIPLSICVLRAKALFRCFKQSVSFSCNSFSTHHSAETAI